MATTKKSGKQLDREISQALGSKKKLWVVIVDGYVHHPIGLGETRAQAKRAIWEKLQRVGFHGERMPAASAAEFFREFSNTAYTLVPGEAKTDYERASSED